jgi:hypothetical protein
MLLNQLWALVPSRRILVTAVVSCLVGAATAIAGSAWLAQSPAVTPDPSPARDPRFVALGKAYLPQLGKAYAAAWEEGAKQLDAGAGISASIDTIAKTWSANRAQLYDHVLTPEFSKIVAESVKDADVTPQERAAMAAAWRGMSVGLGK